jgi:polar amino acid transport system substrate-binding protein
MHCALEPRTFGYLLLALLFTRPIPVQAEQLLLATGEFPPYVGSSLANQGVASQIVSAAFSAVGHEVSLRYLPWRRASAETASGKYAASYPWAMNKQRQEQFLFSQPIYIDHVRFFARLDQGLDADRRWHGKRLCIPDGWDITQVQRQIDHYQLQVEQPSDIANCFHMVEAGRVDLTAINRMVGNHVLEELPAGHNIGVVGEEIALDVNYLIIPRSHPRAPQLLAEFNKGLRRIKQNGRYLNILEAAGLPTASRQP